MESRQVRLRIVSPEKEFDNPETGVTVSGKEILKQMKTNNVWKLDHVGRYCGLQFDGQEFRFREGEITTVPATIASHLRRASSIIVGSDKLNGPILPYLEVVDSFEMTEPKKAPITTTPTTCPICGEDQKTFPALTRHLGKERKLHPELFKEEKTDWDGPQGGTTDEVED